MIKRGPKNICQNLKIIKTDYFYNRKSISSQSLNTKLTQVGPCGVGFLTTKENKMCQTLLSIVSPTFTNKQWWNHHHLFLSLKIDNGTQIKSFALMLGWKTHSDHFGDGSRICSYIIFRKDTTTGSRKHSDWIPNYFSCICVSSISSQSFMTNTKKHSLN